MGDSSSSLEMTTGASGLGGEARLDDLLQKLKLSDTEGGGVFLAKVTREEFPKVKWMAAAKLLSQKEYSEASLMSTMRSAWNTVREVTFYPIGRNLYVVQAFCLGDWKRIMEEGPWLFRGCTLMLEEFDGSTTTPKRPHKVPAWIQIHGVPHLYRTEEIMKQLAAIVGDVILVEMK